MHKTLEVDLTIAEQMDDLGDVIHCNCAFCEKTVQITSEIYLSHKALGHGKFYCPFCLRNNFHHKSSRSVLILTCRGIIGYYYYRLFRETHTLWLSQINHHVEAHEQVGLLNPAFHYDRESLLWFIDFNKVGTSQHKIHIEEVQFTVLKMIESFEIKKTISKFRMVDFVEKFQTALLLFYEKRQRPKSRKILCPTFVDCVNDPEFDFEATRSFCPRYFQTASHSPFLNIP